MSFDDLDQKPMMFGKVYTHPSANRQQPKPAPLTHIDVGVRTGLDFYISDKLNCAPGAEEDTLLIITERVINMIRAREGLGSVDVYTTARTPVDTDVDTDGEQGGVTA